MRTLRKAIAPSITHIQEPLLFSYFFSPFLPFSLSHLAFPEARLFSSLVVHKNNFNYNHSHFYMFTTSTGIPCVGEGGCFMHQGIVREHDPLRAEVGLAGG